MVARVELIGVKNLQQFLERQPLITRKAARLAINDNVRWARNESSRRIRAEVNLTASYLNSPGRLYVGDFASDNKLYATITARRRPTQLSTYGAKQVMRKGRKAGIRVKVKKGGRSKRIRQAFFVNLKRGTASDGNLGVAVRNTEGLNLRKMGVSAGKSNSGFQVLYAPSVDQVFNTVRDDLSGPLAERMDARFTHHYNRLNK